MTNLFKSFISNYQEYAVRRERKKVLETLRRQNDRLLEDAGFSPALLAEGVKAWPWRVESEAGKAWQTPAQLDVAVRELRGYEGVGSADAAVTQSSVTADGSHARTVADDAHARQAA